MVGQGFMEDIDADVCGDFFDHIDDLLDFPSEDIVGGDIGAALDGCWPAAPDVLSLSASSFSANAGGGSGSGSSSSGQSQSIEDDLAAELSVSCEEIAELEWLSNFMDDSLPSVTMDMEKNCTDNSRSSSSSNESQNFQTSSPVSVLESSSSCSGKPMPLSPDTVVPGRARSKRPRPTSFSPRAVVPLVSPASSDNSSDVFPPSPLLPEEKSFLESQPPPKKAPKKKKVAPPEDGAAAGTPQQAVRRCLHCEIQKTPQWRMGPMGPKTLCNACGVRYKSGRLYPEYRPAASPTFVASVHSNSHKKVLEMRIKSGQKGPAPTPEFVRKANTHLLDCA